MFSLGPDWRWQEFSGAPQRVTVPRCSPWGSGHISSVTSPVLTVGSLQLLPLVCFQRDGGKTWGLFLSSYLNLFFFFPFTRSNVATNLRSIGNKHPIQTQFKPVASSLTLKQQNLETHILVFTNFFNDLSGRWDVAIVSSDTVRYHWSSHHMISFLHFTYSPLRCPGSFSVSFEGACRASCSLPDLYQPPRHTEQLSQLKSQIKGLGHARHNIATEVRLKNALQIGFIPSNDERKKKKIQGSGRNQRCGLLGVHILDI